MTDALVEAVARAILESDVRHTSPSWSDDDVALHVSSLSKRNNANKRHATAALHAIEAAGYRVVPVEATREMRVAGEQEMMARHTNLDCFRDPYVDSTYAAMLSAAPRVGEG